MTTQPPAVESSGARANLSGDSNRDDGDKRNSKKKKKKSPQIISTSAFTGKCEDIQDHVYDSVPGKTASMFLSRQLAKLVSTLPVLSKMMESFVSHSILMC
jgi:hypothetical protein